MKKIMLLFIVRLTLKKLLASVKNMKMNSDAFFNRLNQSWKKHKIFVFIEEEKIYFAVRDYFHTSVPFSSFFFFFNSYIDYLLKSRENYLYLFTVSE